MSQTKRDRSPKRILGQFLTPIELSYKLVDSIDVSKRLKILEPSFGEGSFFDAILHRFNKEISDSEELLYRVSNIYGVEIDSLFFDECRKKLTAKYGTKVTSTLNMTNQDFFLWTPENGNNNLLNGYQSPLTDEPFFDLIIGNPPFGGSFNADIEDQLDKRYGERLNLKIKKETYSFFIVRCVELLKKGGRLLFICSNTFMSINTMKGLRNFLMSSGTVKISNFKYFSNETTHPMVILDFTKDGEKNYIEVDDTKLSLKMIRTTPNFSWTLTPEFVPYFQGDLLGKYIVATSGMTVGKNEYFVKEIVEGRIKERYSYTYYNRAITLQDELKKARLHKISPKLRSTIIQREQEGETVEDIKVVPRKKSFYIKVPHEDYKFYNKGCTKKLYVSPTHAIYWKDEGKAVYTYKYNGPWYLHGVGGKKFFGREGITWQLVASKIYARYLPEGYILDSGAPCAFLKENIDHDTLYFILGWLLTEKANQILKKVLNHTRNIQGKDIERLPYPFWVDDITKNTIIMKVKKRLGEVRANKKIDLIAFIDELDTLFSMPVFSFDPTK